MKIYKLAELSQNINMAASIDRSDLLKELQRLADELGDTPAAQDMNEKGVFSNYPYYREFGSWTAALETAGMALNPFHRQT